MSTRYGEGLIDEERRESGTLTEEDLEKFSLAIRQLDPDKLYRQSVVDAGLPRAFMSRSTDELSNFSGLPPFEPWTMDRLEQALVDFGAHQRASCPMSNEELLAWPVGSVSTVKAQRTLINEDL